MKTVLSFLILIAVRTVCFGDDAAVPFYTQLIRGTDSPTPGHESWHPVGPKLSNKFGPKFRWKHYWEVNRQSMSVTPGKAMRVRLTPDREVEIELRDGMEYVVRLYTSGKLARCARQKLKSRMSIMGGGLEAEESWFIVVRRDPPSIE